MQSKYYESNTPFVEIVQPTMTFETTNAYVSNPKYKMIHRSSLAHEHLHCSLKAIVGGKHFFFLLVPCPSMNFLLLTWWWLPYSQSLLSYYCSGLLAHNRAQLRHSTQIAMRVTKPGHFFGFYYMAVLLSRHHTIIFVG